MFIDFWCEIYESVKRKPSRTILTGIGISWGIFILIVLVGIGLGFERGVFKLFNGFSKSTTYVYASETSMGYKGAASGRKIQFQKEDLNMLKSRIPEITHLSPETGRWNAVYAGTKNGWFEVRGVYPDYFLIKLLEVEHGRMLNALDMNEARKVVLIGGEFYQFNLSSCIRQQNSLTAQFVSFSLSNLANIFYPPPIFTIINLCLL